MRIIESLTNKISSTSNLILLGLIFCFTFGLPFFPNWSQPVTGRILISLIFFISIFALETGRKTILTISIIAFVTEWISNVGNLTVLNYISLSTNIIFFQFIIIKLIIQISKRKEVNAGIIVESINGYLMMGLFFTMWVMILSKYNPAAFNFRQGILTATHEFVYFTFTTMTTTGYGDIAPQIPTARSLAILISTSGQIYVAVIIAMLVGKYAGKKNDNAKM